MSLITACCCQACCELKSLSRKITDSSSCVERSTSVPFTWSPPDKYGRLSMSTAEFPVANPKPCWVPSTASRTNLTFSSPPRFTYPTNLVHERIILWAEVRCGIYVSQDWTDNPDAAVTVQLPHVGVDCLPGDSCEVRVRAQYARFGGCDDCGFGALNPAQILTEIRTTPVNYDLNFFYGGGRNRIATNLCPSGSNVEDDVFAGGTFKLPGGAAVVTVHKCIYQLLNQTFFNHMHRYEFTHAESLDDNDSVIDTFSSPTAMAVVPHHKCAANRCRVRLRFYYTRVSEDVCAYTNAPFVPLDQRNAFFDGCECNPYPPIFWTP
jgi:hypothetical protein